MPKSYDAASRRGLVAPVTTPDFAARRRRKKLLTRLVWLLAFLIVADFIIHNLLLLIVFTVPTLVAALIFAILALRKGLRIIERLLRTGAAHKEGQTWPPSADGQLNYGVELYEQGERERALEIFKGVASSSNPSAQTAAWLNVGLISEDLGLPEDAEAAWDKCLASSYGITESEVSDLSNEEISVLANLRPFTYMTEAQIQADTGLDSKQLRSIIKSLTERALVEIASVNFVRRFRLSDSSFYGERQQA